MPIAGPPQEPFHEILKPTVVVKLSYWFFTVWWLVIFAVHTVTSVYNALYACFYWKLGDTYLGMCLEFYQIGMPQPYHYTIATVHAIMSAIHGICILLMLGGSLWQCSLAFTPWSSSNITTDKPESNQIRRWLARIYDEITYPCSLFGVRGEYFEVALVCREIVETALQTVQAYRMSVLLPRAVLNQFYVILLVINCSSSVIVDRVFFQHGEAQRRFACIVFDGLLDLMACMGVELIVMLSYISDYDPDIKGFNGLIWYNDEWVARALNEFQMVVVVSWSDLVSRAVFSLGLAITTTSMKKLLGYLPPNGNRVTQSAEPNLTAVRATQNYELFGAPDNLVPVKVLPHHDRARLKLARRPMCYRKKVYTHSVMHVTRILFVAWGSVVLGFHIHASLQPRLAQCLMQVRPWAATMPSCYLVGLDCHTLGISGTMQEVTASWSKFDSSTVVQLVIRHCSSLQIPDIFNNFHGLRGIKVYNTTIVHWGESAAITNENHPDMSSMLVVRVNMTDGVLPAGFQSTDFPKKVNDIEFCVTNLREIPVDLDTKWLQGMIIQVEYSKLTTLPLAIANLHPLYLFLTGNPITEIPPEAFEVEGMIYLGVSETDIYELPRNVAKVSASLNLIEIGNTEISFFWPWADQLVERVENPALFVAGVTPYCEGLEKIENGVADDFPTQPSTEYSTILMNASEANIQVISRAVDCTRLEKEPFYPLAYEDSINALVPPPPLTK